MKRAKYLEFAEGFYFPVWNFLEFVEVQKLLFSHKIGWWGINNFNLKIESPTNLYIYYDVLSNRYAIGENIDNQNDIFNDRSPVNYSQVISFFEKFGQLK